MDSLEFVVGFLSLLWSEIHEPSLNFGNFQQRRLERLGFGLAFTILLGELHTLFCGIKIMHELQ